MPDSDTYSTLQVASLTKVSLRQLQWWDERGLVCPKFVPGLGGDGFVRQYSEEDLRRVFRMAQLRKAGVSLQMAAKILKSKMEWKTVMRIRKPTVIGDILVVPAKVSSARIFHSTQA